MGENHHQTEPALPKMASSSSSAGSEPIPAWVRSSSPPSPSPSLSPLLIPAGGGERRRPRKTLSLPSQPNIRCGGGGNVDDDDYCFHSALVPSAPAPPPPLSSSSTWNGRNSSNRSPSIETPPTPLSSSSTWNGQNITRSSSTEPPCLRQGAGGDCAPLPTLTRSRRSQSLTDGDVEELRGCIDLGFRFSQDTEEEEDDDVEEKSPKLSSTLPALELYYAINRQLKDMKLRASPVSTLERTSSADSFHSSSSADDWRISCPGDHPNEVKMRLRHWAKVVACSVKQLD